MRTKPSNVATAVVALRRAMPAAAQTLDRIKETAFTARLPRRCTAISFAGSVGKPDGYTIEAVSAPSKSSRRICHASWNLQPARWPGLAYVRARQRHRPGCSPSSDAGQAQGSVVLDPGVRRWDSRGHVDRLRGQAAAAIEADAKSQPTTPVWRGRLQDC
jgi:hypothetical protein